MVARVALLVSLVLLGPACAPESVAPSGERDGGADAAPGTQVCSCPCQQISVPTTQHCWTTSCEPFCGPGSGNAC